VRLNLKRLFKIEQASVKRIKIIPGFSGQNLELDCLNTVCTDTQQPSFVSTLHNLF